MPEDSRRRAPRAAGRVLGTQGRPGCEQHAGMNISVLLLSGGRLLYREAPMNRRLILLSLAGVGIATTGAAQRPGKPDVQAIAHQLVASAMLQEGQSVLISGSVRDAALMEDLAIEARKLGAQPLLAISSERLIRRSYDEVPAKYDGQEPKLDLAVAKLFDAQIA